MEKFKRNYLLDVQSVNGDIITIQPPFSVEFDILRNTLSSANTSTFRIYNLSELNRNKIRKNVWNYSDLRKISFRAGYEDNIPLIFSGNILRAWSARQGVNFITHIEAFDGGFAFANSKGDISFNKDTPQGSIFQSLINSLPGVSRGVIGKYETVTTRGSTYSGNAADLLRELSGGGFFIDNGIANVLGDNECLRGEIELINSDSGLLGTPILEETLLTFDILFEPRLKIGQKIKLDSMTGKNFNGDYKVVSLKHKGIISDSVCGDAITSVGQFASQKLVVKQ